MWRIWEILYQIEVGLNRVHCFIVGHSKVYGGPMEDDWCSRCWIDWPQDRTTVPIILNRCYCWAVEHGFPESVDLWLSDHVRLPGWWEY